MNGDQNRHGAGVRPLHEGNDMIRRYAMVAVFAAGGLAAGTGRCDDGFYTRPALFSHVGSGGGYRPYVNGKLFEERKRWCSRKAWPTAAPMGSTTPSIRIATRNRKRRSASERRSMRAPIPAIAARYPEFAGNVVSIDTRAMVRPPERCPGGRAPYQGNTQSYLEIGDAMARAMLKLMSRK